MSKSLREFDPHSFKESAPHPASTIPPSQNQMSILPRNPTEQTSLLPTPGGGSAGSGAGEVAEARGVAWDAACCRVLCVCVCVEGGAFPASATIFLREVTKLDYDVNCFGIEALAKT